MRLISSHVLDHHGDDEAMKNWMLEILDESPDRLALLKFPPPKDDDHLDAMEAATIRAYDVAKAERPDLGVKLLHAQDIGNGRVPESSIVVVIHEHRWVGGKCVRGCPDTRKAAA